MTPCPLGLAGQCYCANQVSSFAAEKRPVKTAVLLLAHGSPENPDQIPEFLGYVTGGRPFPPTVIEEIRHRYSLIGFSPLACWTLLQADQLSLSLQHARLRRHAQLEALHRRRCKSHRRAKVRARHRRLPRAAKFAHQRRTLSQRRHRQRRNGNAVTGNAALPFTLDFVDEWHDQPLLAKAFAENLRAGWNKANAEYAALCPTLCPSSSPPTVFPQRTITEGDPYEAQSKETAQLVAKAAGLEGDAWTFAFQSQGMSGGLWIGPTVEETILSLKAKGHRGVFIHPVGFLCDHVEVLYDIDIFFKQFAEKQGMRLWRAESLNGSKMLTAALVELVRNHVAAGGVERLGRGERS